MNNITEEEEETKKSRLRLKMASQHYFHPAHLPSNPPPGVKTCHFPEFKTESGKVGVGWGLQFRKRGKRKRRECLPASLLLLRRYVIRIVGAFEESKGRKGGGGMGMLIDLLPTFSLFPPSPSGGGGCNDPNPTWPKFRLGSTVSMWLYTFRSHLYCILFEHPLHNYFLWSTQHHHFNF